MERLKHMISPISLKIATKLKDRAYRHRFFRRRANDEIAMQLRDLRKMRRLSQTDLAQQCSMKQSAVYRIEQASYSRWNIATLWRIAEALDARVRVLFEPMEAVIQQYEEREMISQIKSSFESVRSMGPIYAEKGSTLMVARSQGVLGAAGRAKPSVALEGLGQTPEGILKQQFPDRVFQTQLP